MVDLRVQQPLDNQRKLIQLVLVLVDEVRGDYLVLVDGEIVVEGGQEVLEGFRLRRDTPDGVDGVLQAEVEELRVHG